MTTNTGSARSARRRRVKPHCSAVLAHVSAITELTPHLVRITVTAPEFAGLAYAGSDHYIRLLLPRLGQVRPTLPRTEDWYPEMVAMSAKVRPILRNYTVRDLRPETAEMDIDFVRHGDAGPGSRFALTAGIGDAVGVIDQGVLHEIDHEATGYLVIGDETALPAAAGVLADLHPNVSATAVLEVPSAADIIDLPTPAVADIRYLVRSDPHLRPGSLIREQLSSLAAPTEQTSAWIAGESVMTTTVRRHLVSTLRIPKSAICFHGYFRHGRAQYDD